MVRTIDEDDAIGAVSGSFLLYFAHVHALIDLGSTQSHVYFSFLKLEKLKLELSSIAIFISSSLR